MSDSVERLPLSQHLLAQLVDVEQRIATLLALRDGLKNALLAGGTPRVEATHLRSVSRLLIEKSILNALRSEQSLSTKDLFKQARKAAPALKYSTFRSYLHRLKRRGEIDLTSADGHWKLPHGTRPSDTPAVIAVEI